MMFLITRKDWDLLRSAKNAGLTPETIDALAYPAPQPLPLATWTCSVCREEIQAGWEIFSQLPGGGWEARCQGCAGDDDLHEDLD